MKNILVLLHSDAGQEARFQAGLDLARTLGGHLTCLDVTIVPVFADDFGVTGGNVLLLVDEQEREKANRARLEQRLQAEDVPYSWVIGNGTLSGCVREAALLTDLIVLHRGFDNMDYPGLRDVVVKANRPVVVVPEQSRGFDGSGPALVAWDGSNEAGASLRAAVPLLARAAQVTILQAGKLSDVPQAEEAAAYLSRYGIKPQIVTAEAGKDPGQTILAQIEETKAHYLVMGGFGHNRLVEATMGSVTRRVLQHCPTPIFLAH